MVKIDVSIRACGSDGYIVQTSLLSNGRPITAPEDAASFPSGAEGHAQAEAYRSGLKYGLKLAAFTLQQVAP